jgi:hypothetical protein
VGVDEVVAITGAAVVEASAWTMPSGSVLVSLVEHDTPSAATTMRTPTYASGLISLRRNDRCLDSHERIVPARRSRRKQHNSDAERRRRSADLESFLRLSFDGSGDPPADGRTVFELIPALLSEAPRVDGGWCCLQGAMMSSEPLPTLVTEQTRSMEIDVCWRQHGSAALRFATVLVGPADSHDVTVSAFLRMTKPSTWSTVQYPRAYLFRAVTHEARNLHQQRRRRLR